MPERPRVFAAVVAWNGMEFLPDLLESLQTQTFKDVQVQVVDNASNDGVAEFVRTRFPTATILRNVRNIGGAAARNQAIRLAMAAWPEETRASRYVLVAEPDVALTPACVERLVAYADAHPDVGAVCGKLLRAFREPGSDDPVTDAVRSDVIESAGISARRNRTFYARGAGELDRGQFAQSSPVFAAPSSLMLLRASALEDVKDGDEYFDAAFNAGEEDVDLCWRLRLHGWDVQYVPGASAYRSHSSPTAVPQTRFGFVRSRTGATAARDRAAARNHWCLLLKNEPFGTGVASLPWVLPYEAGRVAYACVARWAALPGFTEALAQTPRLWRKRRALVAARRASGADLRPWFA